MFPSMYFIVFFFNKTLLQPAKYVHLILGWIKISSHFNSESTAHEILRVANPTSIVIGVVRVPVFLADKKIFAQLNSNEYFYILSLFDFLLSPTNLSWRRT